MKPYHIPLYMGLSIGLFACSSPTRQQEEITTQASATDSSSPVSSPNTGTEAEQANDCVRGKAEPVIQKEDYPNTSFVLQADGISGMETVNFDNGDRLIIRNTGCEYYVLSFRFETSQYQHDTTDLGAWYQAAHRLMTGLLGGLHAPLDIKKGLVALESYVLKDEKNNFKNLQLGEEIDFGGNDIRSYVTLESVEKIGSKKYGVTISFAMGPL